MNILFTSDLSGMGGGETSLLNLCDCLKEENNIIVICNCEGSLVNNLKQHSIKSYVVNYREKKTLIQKFFLIRKILKKEKISIVHSNDPLTSVIMFVASYGLRISNYWTCHGQWYRFSLLKKILIKISNKHIFCVSTKVQESLMNMGFRNTSISYLGIPLEKYSVPTKSQILSEFEIELDTFKIAVIGRYQRIKGQLKLVKAIKKLLEDGINITCLLIGGCIYNNTEEKMYFSEISSFITQYSLEKNIIIVGERSDIPSIMKILDLLVIPSDNESFGMVAIEALAAGLAVISTPNDGVSEILDYREEFLAKTNDSNGLYFAIKSYIESSDIQKSAKLFSETRKKEYDIQKIAKKYLEVFTSG